MEGHLVPRIVNRSLGFGFGPAGFTVSFAESSDIDLSGLDSPCLKIGHSKIGKYYWGDLAVAC